MANIKSSKKDARRSAVRAQANRSVRSAVKTHIVKVRRALTEGEKEGVAEVSVNAISALDRAASKGILHSNNAARRKSRLMKRLNAIGAEVAAPAKATPAKKTAAPAKGKAAAAKPATKPAAKPAAKAAGKKAPARAAAKKKG